MYRSGQSLKKTGRNRNWLLRKIWQRSVSVLLSVTMMVPGGAISVYASEAGIKEPDQAIEIYPEDYYEEHILNYQDVDLGYEIGSISDYGDDYVPVLRGNELPASYGYDDFKDYMPSLRNQNPFGSCWAHSAMALAEISLRKKGIIPDADLDLSELHLAYFSYNWVTDPLGGTAGDSNVGANDGKTYMSRGGNLAYAQNILASWTGAANDAGALAYPQNQAGMPQTINTDYAYRDRAHLKNYYNINLDETNEEDMRAAKELIMDLGAIGVSFYAQSSMSASVSGGVYNVEHNAYYDSDSHNNSTNHAVTIVGWDDSFPKEYFTEQPSENGAWLIRNSWTTGSYTDKQSYSGYFWMSYYNANTADKAYAFEFDDESNYDNNYQYDGSVARGYTYYNTDTIYGANVFKASACESGETLKAVSFFTPETNVEYTVSIYTGLTEGTSNPTSGTLKATKTGATTYAGYYTVDLDSAVKLSKDEIFSVVVKFYKSGSENLKLAVEYSHSSNWYLMTASAEQGQSFISSSSSYWLDYGKKNNTNICIKAFTDNNYVSSVDLSTAIVTVENAVYSGSELTPAVIVKSEDGVIINSREYSLSYSNNVNVGTGSVTVTAAEGSSRCTGSVT
ncbi:MAG: hypothetical protein IKQ56_03825, partial [Lachnospiraceae bacterium]|nr:hypothetical protein [Lachnospiraceae bacterium]